MQLILMSYYRAIKSPQILELSGIGDPHVLRRVGVEPKVNLPGVGNNVQEHQMVALSYGMCTEMYGGMSDS